MSNTTMVGNTVVRKAGDVGFTAKIDRSTAPTATVDQNNNSSEAIAYWGDNNNFPKEVLTDVETNDIIPTIIEKKVGLLYNEGLAYGHVYYKDGHEVMEPIRVPEIEDFFERSAIQRYVTEAAEDHFTFYNIFPELVLGKGRAKVARLYNQDATECRLSRQTKTGKNKGRIMHCYLHPNWADASGNPGKDTPKLPVLDPYFDVVGQMEQGKDQRYILPLRRISRGRKYYALAPWNGLRASGWVALAKSIPIWKKSLMENQLSIKYHVEIDPLFFKNKYKDWDKKDEDEQVKLVDEEVDSFMEVMKGEENAGNTVVSFLKSQEHTGNQYSLWKITELNFKIPEGAYVEDSQEADAHIVRGLDFPISLYGITPGKNNSSSGSGSDLRVARMNYILDQRPHIDRILEPLKYISRFNGWNEAYGKNGVPLSFWTKRYFAATLDKNANPETLPGE